MTLAAGENDVAVNYGYEDLGAVIRNNIIYISAYKKDLTIPDAVSMETKIMFRARRALIP